MIASYVPSFSTHVSTHDVLAFRYTREFCIIVPIVVIYLGILKALSFRWDHLPICIWCKGILSLSGCTKQPEWLEMCPSVIIPNGSESLFELFFKSIWACLSVLYFCDKIWYIDLFALKTYAIRNGSVRTGFLTTPYKKHFKSRYICNPSVRCRVFIARLWPAIMFLFVDFLNFS